MKTRVLFIDDEELVLQSLKRVLHTMTREWDMHFVDSGAKALALMAEMPFDIVISDMIMPGMSGVQLLEEVTRLYPATARFILSGHAPGEDVFKCIVSSDHFFAKPADVNAIKAAVEHLAPVEASLLELHKRLKAQNKKPGSGDTCDVSSILHSIKNQSNKPEQEDVKSGVPRDSSDEKRSGVCSRKSLQSPFQAVLGLAHKRG